MKNFVKIAVTALCAGVAVFSLAGCQNTGKSTRLGEPSVPTRFGYEESRSEEFKSIKNNANAFAYRLSEASFADYNLTNNFAVSPVSVFSALSLATECAGGETRAEILNALGVDYGTLSSDYSKLYRSLEGESKTASGDLKSALKLSNSIWITDGVQYNQPCIDNLSQKYFAYSYSADFLRDNENANKAVRAFIKDKTRGLIDKDFQLSDDTYFTLINALYLKDIWNLDGDELSFTDKEYVFLEEDGATRNLKLLRGYYNSGRAKKYEGFSSFFTTTYSGYKIKFIIPDEGRTVRETFTRENLEMVNGETDFGAVDDVNKVRYHTRCLFPEFKASYDGDMKDVLKNEFGLNSFFDRKTSDFSALTQEKIWCGKVRHVSTLTVDKKGIEGAAVTVEAMAGAAGPDEYRDEYADFVVNRSFGFILTDWLDTVLFTGVVNAV